jgi:hypothetical protein
MHKFFYYISISYETVIMCKKISTFYHQNAIDQRHCFLESILCTIPFTKLKMLIDTVIVHTPNGEK